MPAGRLWSAGVSGPPGRKWHSTVEVGFRA